MSVRYALSASAGPLVGALDALTNEVTRRQRKNQAGDAVVLGRPAFNR
jgi:hypothetical protein